MKKLSLYLFDGSVNTNVMLDDLRLMHLQAFADDIEVLGGAEGCDIIVDDIGYVDSPAFRDGPIATAVDTVADSGVLYFSAAGNDGYGVRFTGVSLLVNITFCIFHVSSCPCVPPRKVDHINERHGRQDPSKRSEERVRRSANIHPR